MSEVNLSGANKMSDVTGYTSPKNSNNYSIGNHFFKVLVQIHYSQVYSRIIWTITKTRWLLVSLQLVATQRAVGPATGTRPAKLAWAVGPCASGP